MKRSYKEAWSVEASLEEMRANSGTHFNPALLTIFLNILPKILNIKNWDEKISVRITLQQQPLISNYRHCIN